MEKDLTKEKLQLLYDFTQILPGDPIDMFAMGLLAGHIERVHFVHDLEGAPIAVKLASNKARLWPATGFHALVNNVTIPDPMTLGSILTKNDEPICVKLLHPGLESNEQIQHLFVDDYYDIAAGHDESTQYVTQKTDNLKSQIDHALDVYNECLRQLEKADSEARRKELEDFMQIAKTNLAECSKELKQLETELN